MANLLRSLRDNRRLIRGFVVRDLKARYVGSTMGFFWSVVYPVVNLVVFMIVFRFFLKSRFSDKMNEQETAMLMLAGILVWAAFAETLSRATNCLVENSNLIQKVVFPSEILPVNLALSSIVNMLIGLPIVLIGTWFIFPDPFGPQLVVMPLLILLQIVFMTGMGYFLAALNVLWRDTFHLVGVGTMVWMFMTPIFYPAEVVKKAIPLGDLPEDGYISFGWLLEINPMHWLIDSWRRILFFDQWPEWDMLLRLAVVAIAVFFAGGVFFVRQKKVFPDLL
ncbi:MAG: ABC transporter permease [Planctomycetota bacterium]|nr:ABC transporter permease [Planctomycetota bacterium]